MSISLKEIANMDFEITEVFYLLMNAFFKGFLLRGTITYGKLIHTNDAVFGPGLIDAYNKEKTIAKYPRIIIDDAIVSDLNDLPKKFPYSKDCEQFISRDIDGLYYIDLFKSLRENIDNFWEYTRVLYSICSVLLEMIDNPTINDKYVWLRNKFIAHINRFADVIGFSFENENIDKNDLGTLKMMLDEFDCSEYKKKL